MVILARKAILEKEMMMGRSWVRNASPRNLKDGHAAGVCMGFFWLLYRL